MNKKFTSILLSAVMAATPLTAFAVVENTDSYDGYIYLTAERTVLGQGLIREPEKVGYHKDENLKQIVDRFLDGTQTYSPIYTDYLIGIKDGGEPTGWSTEDIPDDIYGYVEEGFSGRANSDTLASMDYTPTSGYMFSIDNVSMNTSASAVVLGEDTSAGVNFKDGSVVRIMFSLYGYGFDVGMGYEGSDVEWESENTFADRSKLIKTVANIKFDGKAEYYDEYYTDSLEYLSTWDLTEEEIDNAVENLNEFDPSETDSDEKETTSENAKPTETETFTTEPSVTEPSATETSVTEPASETKPSEPTVTEPQSSTEEETATQPVQTETKIESTTSAVPEATTVTEPTTTVTPVKTVVKAKKLSLSSSKKTLNVGKSFTLKAKITPSNTSNKNVSFLVNNKKIASVNSKGKVTAKAKGTTYIIVKTKDGSKLTAKCKLTVKQPVKKITLTNGKKVVNNKTIPLKKGKRITIKAKALPSNANNKAVKWSVSSKKVATVSKGVVKAKSKGTTWVKAAASDGSKVTAKVRIKVQ